MPVIAASPAECRMEACRHRCGELRHCVVTRRLTPLLRRVGCVVSQRRAPTLDESVVYHVFNNVVTGCGLSTVIKVIFDFDLI